MLFDVNQTEFPSEMHKEVWQIGKAVLPLEVTLARIDDSEMWEGCTQIYNWTQNYLEALYKNPQQFEGHNPNVMFRLLDDVAEDTTIVDNGNDMAFSAKRYEYQIVTSPCFSDLPLVGLKLIDYNG